MYENIDFDNIDLTQNPPQKEPDRQYYYIAKARQYVQEKSRKKGRHFLLLELICCIRILA